MPAGKERSFCNIIKKNENIIVVFMLLHRTSAATRRVTKTTHSRKILCIEDLTERFNWSKLLELDSLIFCDRQTWERGDEAAPRAQPAASSHTRWLEALSSQSNWAVLVTALFND